MYVIALFFSKAEGGIRSSVFIIHGHYCANWHLTQRVLARSFYPHDVSAFQKGPQQHLYL